MSSESLPSRSNPGSDDNHQFSPISSVLVGPRTAVHDGLKMLKSYISYATAFKHGRTFEAKPSIYRRRALEAATDEEGLVGAGLTNLYVGISAVRTENQIAVVAIAIRDSVYLHDFSVKHLELENSSSKGRCVISDYVISELSSYEKTNFCKFLGAGLPNDVLEMSPTLCSALWAELDIIPISMKPDRETRDSAGNDQAFWNVKDIDEQADSMSRKCIMFFGPEQSPLLQVGYRGLVEIDAGFRSHMCAIKDYEAICKEPTWTSVMKFATELKQKGTKIAFFSSTPQGGGVALMRHALVRFARVVGVELKWYVPKPKPGVFRITKTVHNILQGVAKPDERISSEEKQTLTDWIKDNANRYWLSDGGPLRDPSEGGADVIIVDDPQMPGIIPLAKRINHTRPVFYRSHIQIRSDLIETIGTPQAEVWQFLWEKIQHADMFISHPIPAFVPKDVPPSKLAYLPATTDWLDGLNKTLNEWDMGYYIHLYNKHCMSTRMTQLKYPNEKYFIQIARFDPAKGIPDVIKSYSEFRRLHQSKSTEIENLKNVPQLLIVGNGSIDDPDGTIIYDTTMSYLETHAAHLISSISIMRLPPNDQLLNTLLSNAHTVLQVSTREGFEVKVSEALHKGRPIIATQAGGIPLQVQHGKNGFLVQPGDWRDAGQRLFDLWTDTALYERMSEFARTSVSDEVGTVGNALSWFYLAAKWTSEMKGGVEPMGRWVNDMAREEAGCPYAEGENRLPRSSTVG